MNDGMWHDGGLISLFGVADWRGTRFCQLVFSSRFSEEWTMTTPPACKLGLPLPSGLSDRLVAAQRESCLS